MLKKGEGASLGASPLAMNLATGDSTVAVVMMIDATIGKKRKECSTPPSEPVKWLVQWMDGERFVIARTAWEAHTKAEGAPCFGSCNIRRLS